MHAVNFSNLRPACIALLMLASPWLYADEEKKLSGSPTVGKPVIYQIFTRLFGNKKTTHKLWGTIEENGVGKFNDINDQALDSIKQLGATHVWYTGVLHHAVIRDYANYGISNDDPDVVKGRAGSPYAVKDYYNVDPDLAIDPSQRLQEFQALIARTHKHGLKVIIDIIPNHVTRQYHSLNNPAGQEDFGASDDATVEYKRDNNFYYIVGESFKVPNFTALGATESYKPLGGEEHPLSDGAFAETPAKWTGNGSRKSQPNADDWYETVKINYGVKPNGDLDFPRLPGNYAQKNFQQHAAFWQDKNVPNTWKKFRAITDYWLAMGVDGFRYDMAEMVPVEFWSYLNSSIKTKNADAFLIAEVYTPSQYRDYIQLGKMDYLYDKVGIYDNLKAIIQHKGSTDSIANNQKELLDIEEHMLHFLENHDEQRIASSAFAGNAVSAKPAMVVSATISRAPTMIYFGQEVGEPGAEDTGFGHPSRTTIFDYWGVPSHQRWMNNGKFDGGKLTAKEKSLRDFYSTLLNFSATAPALQGAYQEIHYVNRQTTKGYDEKLFAFARWQISGDITTAQKLLVISNFSATQTYSLSLQVPTDLLTRWALNDGDHKLFNALASHNKKSHHVLRVKNGTGLVSVTLKPLQSIALELRHNI